MRLTPQMKSSRGIFGGRESRGGDRVYNEDGVGDSKGVVEVPATEGQDRLRTGRGRVRLAIRV